MPLFVVRPSRGAWGFFALVVLGALGARAATRHEARVVQQDRPAADTAHALAACLLGENARWVLRDPDERDALLRWTHGAATTLRAAAALPQEDAWPRPCAALAAQLQRTLLRASTTSQPTLTLARELRDQLDRASAERDARFSLLDGDQVAPRLAALMMQVRALSPGSRAVWDAGLAGARSFPLRATWPPRPGRLPDTLEQPVLGEPGVVYGRGVWDGMLHAVRLDTGRATALGPAVPLREEPRGDLLRAWRDDGPRMVSTGARPALVPLPRDVRMDDPTDFRWDSVVDDDARALLTVSAGTARVYVAAANAPERWSAPQSVGAEESALAAVLSGSSAAGWSVTTLRPRLNDVALERFAVARGATDEALTVGPAEAVRTPGVIPATVAQVETCRGGDAAYMAVWSGDAVYGLRVEGAAARVGSVRMTLPRGARMRARCDASRLLVTVAPTSAQGAAALFTFERGASPATTLVEPPPGGVTDVHAMLLVRRAVLAVVSSAGAVRAWRYVAGDALGVQSNRWEPGGLMMDLVPAARVRRAVTQAQAQGRDDEVTLLLDLAQAPRVIAQTIPDQPMSPFEERPARQWSPAGLAVFVSHDGGLTFGPPGSGARRPIPR